MVRRSSVVQSMTSSQSRGDSVNAAASSSHAHYKEGIRLAEVGEWEMLMGKLKTDPQLARHKDHHGMLPLHWACTEDDVPSSVLEALLAVYPESIITKNNAQYLPIHIAVRAMAPKESLRLLCKARPSVIVEETPSGKTPLMLAVDVGLPADSMQVLKDAEREYSNSVLDADMASFENTKKEIERQSQMIRESMMKRPFNIQPDLLTVSPEKPPQEPVVKHLARPSQMLRESMMSRPFGAQPEMRVSNILEEEEDEEYLEQSAASWRTTSTPRGKGPFIDPIPYHGDDNDASSSEACGVCGRKFSMFRIKHQCKGCHMYLCKAHVAGKAQLPQFEKKRTVCSNCFQAHLGNAGGITVRPLGSDSIPVTMRRRRTSSSQYTNAGNGHSVAGIKHRPRSTDASVSSRGSRKNSSIDRFESETASNSVSDQERNSAEVAALIHRVMSLEYKNKSLTSRLAEQEKQYGEAMLLLTQTMTRVAELELRVAGGNGEFDGVSEKLISSLTLGAGVSSSQSSDFDFPSPFTEKN